MWIDRRLLLIGGGASLLLNVFLVGLVVGQGVGRLRRAPPAAGGGIGPVVHQGHLHLLSPDERRRFQGAMAPYRPAIRAAREAVRARRQAVEAAIAAPRYDRDAVVADFAALRAAEAEVAAKLHAGLVEAMGELPQPARAALVAHEAPKGGAAKGTPAATGPATTAPSKDDAASGGAARSEAAKPGAGGQGSAEAR